MTDEQDPQGFTVKDKRLFREDGNAREEAPPPEPPKGANPEPPTSAGEPQPGQEPPPGTGGKIDFPSYILSYYTQGLVLLGEGEFNPYYRKMSESLGIRDRVLFAGKIPQEALLRHTAGADIGP